MNIHLIQRLLLTASVVAMASAAKAQDAGAERAVSEIVVTGTNIRGLEVSATQNLQVVDRVAIQQTNALQVADLIAAIPGNTGTALYNETGQLTGTAQFQLRGLGFSSTLTLLNGRRAGIAPLTDKSGSNFVDINQFPLAMIARIDALKDGASAIYGSEAVAGVVNIVTRKGFEGLELSAQAEQSVNEAYSVNLAMGRRFDRGSINVYATYYQQSGALRPDFDWLKTRIGGGDTPGKSVLLSAVGYPGTYSLAAFNAAGQPTLATSATTVPDPGCEAAGGLFQVSAAGVVNRTRCNFNSFNQIGVIPDQDRYQAFIEGDYRLTDRVKFFTEASASQNVNRIYKQPGGYANGTGTGTAAGFVYVPASAPFNFFVVDPTNPRNIIYKDPATWNPAVDRAVDVMGNFRPQGVNFAGDKRQTNTYFRALNGFDVTLPAEWSGSLSHLFAYAQFEEEDPVRVNSINLNRLIASGAYNPFATSLLSPNLVSPKDGRTVAANSKAILDQIFYTAATVRRTEQHVVDLSASGPLVTLPTGRVTAAIGAQYRRQTLRYVPDSLSAQGLADTAATDEPFYGVQTVKAAYAELSIPLTEIADLHAAVRREDYGKANGGASTDPKIDARVKLFDNRLQLRGSWGTSFQAPTLSQNATSQALAIINDPVVVVNGAFACSPSFLSNNVNVKTVGGGLKPQSSTNYGFGATASPIPGLNATVDYWRYSYSDLIAAGQNGQAIVNGQCVNGVFKADPRVARGASGQIFGITTAYTNVGRVVTDGVDMSLTYHRGLGALGDLNFRGDATYVRKFDAFDGKGGVQHNAGGRNFNNNFAPIPRWRATGRIVYAVGDHEALIGANYTSGYRNDQSGGAPIADFLTFDLQYSYRFAVRGLGASRVTLGVKNLFDKDPPSLIRYDAAGKLISGTTSDIDRPGYDPLAGADIRGRIVSLRLQQTF